MITETSTKDELFTAINQTLSEMVGLTSLLDENKINSIPYKDSWTAGQLIRHVTKSTNEMAKAMSMESKPAKRDPGEKILHLKKVFLDFSNKIKSPDFIVPEDGPYKKQTSIDEINKSFEQFKDSTNNANLNDILEGLPLGEITKLEALHFVLYHTQRHLQQMKKICDTLKIQE
ncbi:DinB family protein [Flavobacterium sp. ZB4R12]|uniref:DinB family protein n=1 Tax=Flavobacterium sp. ZB4R12 TaxID=3398732 RepID=UPI003AAB9F70